MMKRLLSPNVSTPKKTRKLYRLSLFWGLLLLAAIAIMACGPAAGSGPQGTSTLQSTPTPQATPTPEPQLVEEPAPIESVTIEVTATEPRQAELAVVSGLPTGRPSFQGASPVRGGDTLP